MPICKNPQCNKQFPSTFWVEGRRRNLGNRTYCLECSPFGSKNTRRLDGKEDGRKRPKVVNEEGYRVCKICFKTIKAQKGKTTTKGTKCLGCCQRARKQIRSKLIYDIVGTSCWNCGYDKGRAALSVLEWHHLDPATKLLSLSAREVTFYTWKKVAAELKKCVLLCCLCHREHHAGLITVETIEEVHTKMWKKYILPE